MMVTQEDHFATLAFNAAHREKELYSYQMNIDNYTMMLEALPAGEWPPYLVEYKTTDIAALPENLPEEDVDVIADYQYRDRLKSLLRSEKVEYGKVKRVLDVLLAQIPVLQRESLLTTARATIAAAV